MDFKTIDPADTQNRACLIMGTRPGTIMFSPIIRELERRGTPYFMLHTGQHYSQNMDAVFFDELGLPRPKHRLYGLKDHSTHGAQTAEMLRGCEEVMMRERPRLVVVGGDTNANLAGALAARKLRLKVMHVEAGERCHNWAKPEEHNRVMIDHISDYLLATNSKSRMHLVHDNVQGQIVITGNPIVTATRQNILLAQERGVRDPHMSYILLTMHREENDSIEALENIIEIVKRTSLFVVFPMHPRTKKRVEQASMGPALAACKNLEVLEPQGYLDFLGLLSHATVVVTDSLGVQQEAFILHKPCVTLNSNTEWGETLGGGGNVLAGGTDPVSVCAAIATQYSSATRQPPITWGEPFGDESSAGNIVDVIEEALA